MIEKKICMLGSFAVGKTSLVRRYVKSIYDDAYHTTVGVKVDKKVLKVGDTDLTLILWDLYGEDEFQKMKWTYLRGSSGYLLVADGTRRATIERALAMEQKVREEVGEIPFILVINKNDLVQEWDLDPVLESHFNAKGWTVLHSSAKTGENVDEAFHQLARKILS
ncbi:MAG TPA: Rab family GTPase [Candidatus Acidoferrum sp.]|nr:Rab family GTPase [Candidatus Acidoferrum sp.]